MVRLADVDLHLTLGNHDARLEVRLGEAVARALAFGGCAMTAPPEILHILQVLAVGACVTCAWHIYQVWRDQ